MFHAECRELFLNTDVFFPFSCIRLLRFEILIRFGIWLADPDIKDCRLLVLPEPTCKDIQSRILCFVRPSKLLNRFPRNDWLGFLMVTYRTQKFGFQILARCDAEQQNLLVCGNHIVVYGKNFPLHRWRENHPLVIHSVVLFRLKPRSCTGSNVSLADEHFSVTRSNTRLVFRGIISFAFPCLRVPVIFHFLVPVVLILPSNTPK